MLERLWVVGILLVVASASPVLAGPGDLDDVLGPGDDPVPSGAPGLVETQDDLLPVSTPETPADGLLDRLLTGTGDLVAGLGGALRDGVVGAVSAIGDFFSTIATAAWTGLTVGSVAAWGALVWSATGVLGLMTGTVTGITRVAAGAATGLWGLIGDAGLGLARLRPEGMSEAAWAGTVATGVTAGSAAAHFGLLSGLKKFGWLGGLGAPLFTRIAKDDILDHPLRSEIFETIKSNPGIHISQLARTVDAGWGTTIHHLRKLQEKELVAVRMVNNQKCYFQNGGQVSRSAWTQLPELKNETANRIAQFILHHPLSPVTTISDSLGLSPSLVSHHVRKLERAGVVEKVRDGRFVKLTVPEAARAIFDGGVPTQVPTPAGVAA